MSLRTVYGNDHSENGWPMVDAESCEWITVPGTDVSLQIQSGWPLQILRAWAADWNAYVEPLRDADSACWTEGNSVATSNHLSGTAEDLNWQNHDFHVSYDGFTPEQIATVREMLDFYENSVFWGQDWGEQGIGPFDCMHSQLNGDTYQNPHTGDFISRKIRANGYSTFRRGDTVPPPELSRADRYAVAIIAEGRRRSITDRGMKIAISVALVESNLRMYANTAVPDSLNYPHDAVGSDHDSIGLFQQRSPMWGGPECLMNPACSAGLFYDRLVAMDYNNPGRSPGSFAADIQRPAARYRGRYDERYPEASDLFDRLAPLPPGPAPPTLPEEGFLMALTPKQQQEIYDVLCKPRVSSSPLRHLGEGTRGNIGAFIGWMDGNEHVQYVELLARLGSRDSITLLHEIAGADPTQYPDRQWDRRLAQGILDRLAAGADPAPTVRGEVVAPPPAPQPSTAWIDELKDFIRDTIANQPAPPAPPAPEPQIVYTPAPQPPTVIPDEPTEQSTGQLIGKTYDALQSLRLADALPIEERAPLAALIAVLTTKNGSQL